MEKTSAPKSRANRMLSSEEPVSPMTMRSTNGEALRRHRGSTEPPFLTIMESSTVAFIAWELLALGLAGFDSGGGHARFRYFFSGWSVFHRVTGPLRGRRRA